MVSVEMDCCGPSVLWDPGVWILTRKHANTDAPELKEAMWAVKKDKPEGGQDPGWLG